YATEKSLKEYGDKVSPAERADIEAKANDLKAAIKDKNVDRVKKGMEGLTKASHKLAEEVYKQANAKQQQEQQQQAQSAGAQGEGSSADEGSAKDKKPEDIIDADFKEEDGKK
ncbi:MAG: Hsp70 family protein, partial [Candidatus Omnitrophota bacterium]